LITIEIKLEEKCPVTYVPVAILKIERRNKGRKAKGKTEGRELFPFCLLPSALCLQLGTENWELSLTRTVF
jgi:hypothetical protein